MQTETSTKAGKRTLSQQNVLEQLTNAERALKYAWAASDEDGLRAVIKDNLFRVSSCLSDYRTYLTRKEKQCGQ